MHSVVGLGAITCHAWKMNESRRPVTSPVCQALLGPWLTFISVVQTVDLPWDTWQSISAEGIFLFNARNVTYTSADNQLLYLALWQVKFLTCCRSKSVTDLRMQGYRARAWLGSRKLGQTNTTKAPTDRQNGGWLHSWMTAKCAVGNDSLVPGRHVIGCM